MARSRLSSHSNPLAALGRDGRPRCLRRRRRRQRRRRRPGRALTCDTKAYVAGSVTVPTATQLATYAGTYNGDEGAYGPNPGDPFVKSASAALVLGTDGSLSYKGSAYTPTSVCIEKAAGPYGTILYIIAGKGHLDIADKADATLGSAWGMSLADGTTIFTKGAKK